MDNSESQDNELLALGYIYEEKYFIVDDVKPPCGRFIVNIRLPKPFKVYYSVIKKELEEQCTFEIEHLPPMTLFFQFPQTYPTDTGPAFLLSCDWLPLVEISCLCKKMDTLWRETKDAILFTWIQFLEEETLSFLERDDVLDITELLQFDRTILKSLRDDLMSRESNSQSVTLNSKNKDNTHEFCDIIPSIYSGHGLIDKRAVNDLSNGKFLIQKIKNYNKFRIYEVFCDSNQYCQVCLSSKKGSDFVVFEDCQHAFCKECVKYYFEVQISSGNVQSLECLNEACKTHADSFVIKELVDKEHFEKYDSLLLSRTLDNMSDIAYCPRKECQCAVMLEPCGRMGVCSNCQFVFCPFCKMAYHGIAPCRLKHEEMKKLFDEYCNGDTATKVAIEKRYGKRNVQILIEDTMSETWKNTNSKNCPHCNASIEKDFGCNKMTCFKCGSFFCWLCMEKLNNAKPYIHFNQQNSSCFGQLFPDDYEEVLPGQYLDFY